MKYKADRWGERAWKHACQIVKHPGWIGSSGTDTGESSADAGRPGVDDRTGVGNRDAGVPSEASDAPTQPSLYVFTEADMKKFIEDNPGIVGRNFGNPADWEAAKKLIREKNCGVRKEFSFEEMASERNQLFRKVRFACTEYIHLCIPVYDIFGTTLYNTGSVHGLHRGSSLPREKTENV